jgi:serine/threonine-protein kinase
VIGGVFKVRGFVADGSIAQIVSAVYDGTPRQCVLKVLLPAHASDPDTTDRFLDVARASAELDHPSIVRGLGAGEERGWVWAASELVVGENLDTYVERRARSSRDA